MSDTSQTRPAVDPDAPIRLGTKVVRSVATVAGHGPNEWRLLGEVGVIIREWDDPGWVPVAWPADTPDPASNLSQVQWVDPRPHQPIESYGDTIRRKVHTRTRRQSTTCLVAIVDQA